MDEMEKEIINEESELEKQPTEVIEELDSSDESREEIVDYLQNYCNDNGICDEESDLAVNQDPAIKTGFLLAVAGGVIGGGVLLYKKVIKPKIIPAIKKKKTWIDMKRRILKKAKSDFENEYVEADIIDPEINFLDESEE